VVGSATSRIALSSNRNEKTRTARPERCTLGAGTGERGGPQTRARIAEVAARLFADRGFDAVTVAEVGREVGVSSVTVVKHFPREEDLHLDRADDAVDLLRAAVRGRTPGSTC